MKLIVNPHKIEIDKSPVNEKEIKVTEIEFEFSEEIPVNYVKDVYFTLGSNTYQVANIQNNKCNIPYEVLESKGQVEIGVVAYLLDSDEYIKRYNPSPVYFSTWEGSLKDEYDNTEEITPTDKEQLEQELNDGLIEIREAVETITTAVEEANNLDLDVSKEGKVATVTLTKKDASVKTVTLSDGTNLMFNWSGTSLGIKTDEDEEYTYVDLQGVQGEQGPMGAPFTIKKTYSSVAEMNADFNNMNVGDYVMIASTVEIEDNAKLYTRGEEQWIFITDFSGATGIQGPTGATPNIQIGTVTSGQSPSVTRTGTNENPVLNFVLQKGDTGATGETGATGATGNGIADTNKTGTSGLVDTYTITYTNGNTTTFTVTNGEDGEVTQEQFDRAMMVYNALPKITDTDTEITLNGTANCPMELELNPSELTQETTTGKNIFNPTYMVAQQYTTGGASATAYSLSNGVISTNVNLDTGRRFLNKLSYEASTYTVSGKVTFKNNTNTRLYYSVRNLGTQTDIVGGTRIAVGSNSGTFSFSFTVPSASSDISFSIQPEGSPDGTIELSDIQLEKSASATPYEPYTGGIPQPNPSYPSDVQVIKGNNTITISNSDNSESQVLPLNLPDGMEYCKIGDYEDEFEHDLDTDKWYINKATGKVVLNGTENWSNAKNITDTNIHFSSTVIDGLNIAGYGISNRFIYYNGSLWGDDIVGFNILTNEYNLRVRIPKTELSDITTVQNAKQSFITWLGTNNVIVYYVLSTTTHTEITDATLISQLNAIENAVSYDEQTNISQTNAGLPFRIKASAVRSLVNIFDLIGE